MTWQTMESAPKDGSLVDLWIIGPDDTVDFYAPNARRAKNRISREGRTTDMQWLHKHTNTPNWYPAGGLGYPLAPEVTPIFWNQCHAPDQP